MFLYITEEAEKSKPADLEKLKLKNQSRKITEEEGGREIEGMRKGGFMTQTRAN